MTPIHVSGFHYYKVDGKTVKQSENHVFPTAVDVVRNYNTLCAKQNKMNVDILGRLIETGRTWTCWVNDESDDFYELTFDEAL